MKKISCVGIPDKLSADKIEALMKYLSQISGSVKSLRYFPHFSLRNDFEVDELELENLFKKTDLLVNQYTEFKFVLSKYEFYPWRIISLPINPTVSLINLHQDIMELIQQFRTSWISPEILANPIFSGKQKEYILMYGYQFAFEFFSPHFTLCGPDMEQKIFEKIKGELLKKRENLIVKVSRLAYVDWSKNEILKEFKFSDSVL